jgi:hypothetical protein
LVQCIAAVREPTSDANGSGSSLVTPGRCRRRSQRWTAVLAGRGQLRKSDRREQFASRQRQKESPFEFHRSAQKMPHGRLALTEDERRRQTGCCDSLLTAEKFDRLQAVAAEFRRNRPAENVGLA